MTNLEELLGTDCCALCDEPFTLLDVEHGNVAEMHDPEHESVFHECGMSHCSGIVHVGCGQGRGWELS